MLQEIKYDKSLKKSQNRYNRDLIVYVSFVVITFFSGAAWAPPGTGIHDTFRLNNQLNIQPTPSLNLDQFKVMPILTPNPQINFNDNALRFNDNALEKRNLCDLNPPPSYCR